MITWTSYSWLFMCPECSYIALGNHSDVGIELFEYVIELHELLDHNLF
jgi:hypothetical protein